MKNVKKSFGNFNAELPADHKVEIIPCPYDKTTSYGHGTDKGPEGVIEASQELEFYDDECGYNPSTLGIKTLEPLEMELQDKNTAEPFKALQDKCADAYARAKFPIVLGGEHSLSLGPIKAAFEKCGGKMTLLHFDAHADLRDQYLDNPYSHAAAIYQVYKHCPGIKIVSVGIRNISEGEVKWLTEEKPDIRIFFARHEMKNCFNEQMPWTENNVLHALRSFGNDDIYLTFDVDGYDSGIMPSTGTPEPGGLDWYTPLNIIREATKNFNLVGADVVELAPIDKLHGPDFLVAKLVYKIISYKFAK